MFSKKAKKIGEIFNVNLMLRIKRQINGEDFVNFRGLRRKYELCLCYVPDAFPRNILIIHMYILQL